MINIPALTKRELSSYFFSPIAYIVMTAFLVIEGYFFAFILNRSQEAVLRYGMGNTPIILLFAIPIITMRLLAEETKSGTIETLMTAPVTDMEVVLGKFLASVCFVVVMLVPTLFYVLLLEWVGEPDYGPIVSLYAGLVLLGGTYVAIGLLASAFTRNQIVAAIVSFIGLLLFWVIGWAGGEGGTALAKFFQYVAIMPHFESFGKGMIDFKDVVYYLSAIVFCLFLTMRVVESRKWR